MKTKVLLAYFSGTGNTFTVIMTLKALLEDKGYEPILHAVNSGIITGNDFGFYGFCFPVYGLGLPRIAKKFISGLEPLKERKKAFLIVTGGDKNNNGWSLQEGVDMLSAGNFDVTYTGLIHMPNNWAYGRMSGPEESGTLLTEAYEKTGKILDEFLSGKRSHKSLNFDKFGAFKSKIIYDIFKNRGIKKMWKLFRIDSRCSGCGLCARKCPVKAIAMKQGKPEWNAACEQCMRCVNYCPENAVRQPGMKKNKRQYHAPGFRPEDTV